MTLHTRSNEADYPKVRPRSSYRGPNDRLLLICNDGEASSTTFNAHELTLIPQTVARLITMLSLFWTRKDSNERITDVLT